MLYSVNYFYTFFFITRAYVSPDEESPPPPSGALGPLPAPVKWVKLISEKYVNLDYIDLHRCKYFPNMFFEDVNEIHYKKKNVRKCSLRVFLFILTLFWYYLFLTVIVSVIYFCTYWGLQSRCCYCLPVTIVSVFVTVCQGLLFCCYWCREVRGALKKFVFWYICKYDMKIVYHNFFNIISCNISALSPAMLQYCNIIIT